VKRLSIDWLWKNYSRFSRSLLRENLGLNQNKENMMTKQEVLERVKSAGVVAVGAGSELCPPQLAKEGKFDEISRRAAEFVRVVNKARTAGK
jgi:hypothetical protein